MTCGNVARAWQGGRWIGGTARSSVSPAYELDVRPGTRGGANVLRIQVGNLTKDATIIGQ